MKSPLFKSGDEKTQAVVIGAAVALHGLLAASEARNFETEQLVRTAFAISREFWKQAEQEIGA